MKGKDIEPGTAYALRPWQRQDQPLRAVTAIRAEGRYLVYEGPNGDEWTGALSRVVGPWPPHAEAREAAQAARDQLYLAQETPGPAGLVFEYAQIVEYGYCDFRIHLTCAAVQVTRLAKLISALNPTCDDSGSGDATPEPPIGSN